MRNSYIIILMLISAACAGQNQPPELSNLNVDVPWGSNTAVLNFDVSDAENDDLEIKVLLSDDGGLTYRSQVGSTSGDIGFPITAGTGKQIVIDFDTISDIYAYSLRLVADDRMLPDIQSIVDQVDSVQLSNDLEQIQGIRHYQTGTAHLEETKDLIENRFNQYGLSTHRQDFQRGGYTGQNIIGRKAGLGQEQTNYIIDAHFDTVSDAPGADDNGSGVVGFLEALRVLAPFNFDRTITFVGFDFEEVVGLSGTYGSLKYVQEEIPSWEDLAGVINFEMIGYYDNAPNSQTVPNGFNLLFPDELAVLEADSFRGNFVVNVGDAESYSINAAFDTLSAMYVPQLKVTTLTVPLNGTVAPDFRRSDHANFWDIDAPALMITDGANMRNPNYHTPEDSIGQLNFTFMSNIVKAAVATLATVAGIQHSTYADADILPSGISASTFDCDHSVWPNPSTDRFIIDLGDCFGSMPEIHCSDLEGQTIDLHVYQKGPGRFEVDMENAATGMYFLEMTARHRRITQKLFVLP